MRTSLTKSTLNQMLSIRQSNNINCSYFEYYSEYSTSQLRAIKNSLHVPNKKQGIFKTLLKYIVYYNNIYNRNLIQKEIEARKICINYCVMNNLIVYENYLT